MDNIYNKNLVMKYPHIPHNAIWYRQGSNNHYPGMMPATNGELSGSENKTLK